MKTIFVDAHVFDGEFQGTLTYIKELYSELLRINSDVICYFGARDINNVRKYFNHFENVRYISYKSTSSLSRIFIEIPKLIDKLECSYAHFQYIIPLIKNKNCKYIVTTHDLLFVDFPDDFSFLYRFKRNFLFRVSAKRSDYLLTVSKYSKSKISKHFNIALNRIIVIPNGVSTDFFAFESSNSSELIKREYGIEKYILYVSRIEPRKNQTMLVELFVNEKLWQKGYTLVLIGSHSLKSDLFNIIDQLSDEVRKYIIWKEQVKYEMLKHFLKAAAFFVYPSKFEGFGIPPLEAAALGTPVICSNKTAMKDFYFFEPFLFNPDSYEDLLQKVNKMISERGEIELDVIKNQVRNEYSWAKSASIFNQIILNESK